jgi:hypothetical protein
VIGRRCFVGHEQAREREEGKTLERKCLDSERISLAHQKWVTD